MRRSQNDVRSSAREAIAQAQAQDWRLKGVGRDLRIHGVKLIFQADLEDDLTRTSQQVLQQGQLPGDGDPDASDLKAPAGGVQRNIARTQDNAQTSAGASQEGPATRRQLGDVEGLDQIVIGADVERARGWWRG